MSITTATKAEALTLRDANVKASYPLQKLAQSDREPGTMNAAQITETDAALTALVNALAAADAVASGTVYTLKSGFALTGVTPSGTFSTTVTFTVANGAITAIALS